MSEPSCSTKGWKLKVSEKRGSFPLFHLSAFTQRSKTLTRLQLKMIQTVSNTAKLEINPAIFIYLANIPYPNYDTALASTNKPQLLSI